MAWPMAWRVACQVSSWGAADDLHTVFAVAKLLLGFKAESVTLLLLLLSGFAVGFFEFGYCASVTQFC
jgi:hypothetical protein